MQADIQLSIAICDDDPADRKEIADLTQQLLRDASMECRISAYSGGMALLEDIRAGAQYDLLLMDVLLEDMDGITLAAKLRQQNNDVAIIFISANREMALRGYEVSAARYLAKPPEREKLKEALLHCCGSRQVKKEILLPTDRGQYRIPCAEIRYVEAFERGAKIFLGDETLVTRLKFSEVDALLPKASFVMCHRAYIVNLAYTRRIGPKDFEMVTGIRIPISKYRYQQVSRQFVRYVAG